MKTVLLDDGRWHHTFRQSSLKTATICLERARAEYVGDMPKVESDAACVGTAVHAAIEDALLLYRDEGRWQTQEAMEYRFEAAFNDLEALPEFRRIKYTADTARSFGRACIQHWYQEIRETLDPLHVELNFTVPLIEDDQRVIDLTGTIDLIDGRHGIGDWKTSGGGPYQEWQYHRWSVQASAYTYAAHTLGLDVDDRRFTYYVLHKNGVQVFTVERDAGWWRWLKDQAVALSVLMEAGLERWPLNDTHALCSEKWCGIYSACKGKSLTTTSER